jgi:hypothetical protein
VTAVELAEVPAPWFPSNSSNQQWSQMATVAPQLVSTMRRYLLQLTTFLAPRSVDVADQTLRQFARWLTANTEIRVVADIARSDIEDYKVWLVAQPGTNGRALAKNTQRHRLRMIRIFLERLIEWDWPDAPGRNPILHGDIPPRTDPIPKFLTDQQAAAFMAAAKAHRLPRYRLVAQVLARTGLPGHRTLRTRRRRRHPHRRRPLLAPGPGRETPQRPHDPHAPRSRGPLRRVDRHQQRAHPPEPATAR